MKLKRTVLSPLLSFILIILLPQTTFVLASPPENYPGQAQINWLIRQQDRHNSGLVQSYERDNDVNAWTFDQALAIIAFTEANELNRARMILNEMNDVQLDDTNGPWNEWHIASAPNDIDPKSEKYVTGPIAWMVIAINYYENETNDVNYAPMAHRALGWLDTMQCLTQGDNRYGSLRWCDGPACSDFDANKRSTEHNIDAYSAYYWRGILDSNNSYLEKSYLIRNYLQYEMWGRSDESNCDDKVSIFWEGYNGGGYNGCFYCTDAQSWGVLALGPIGQDGEQFYESLCWLLCSKWGNTRNKQDYTYDINDVDGFRGSTGDKKCITVDFTEHVAAAFYSIGDDVKGDFFHDQMGRIVGTNGGLVHSFSSDDPNVECRYNYVASVAWYYFNEVKINPFILSLHPPGCRAANINKENFVNLEDLAIFALDWLGTNPESPANIDGNSPINFLDFAILAKYWLCGCDDTLIIYESCM